MSTCGVRFRHRMVCCFNLLWILRVLSESGRWRRGGEEWGVGRCERQNITASCKSFSFSICISQLNTMLPFYIITISQCHQDVWNVSYLLSLEGRNINNICLSYLKHPYLIVYYAIVNKFGVELYKLMHSNWNFTHYKKKTLIC